MVDKVTVQQLNLVVNGGLSVKRACEHVTTLMAGEDKDLRERDI